MAVRDIVIWPDPVLTTRSEPVEAVTDDMQALFDDMAETMYAADGLGLAAPQIGLGKRIFVVDTSSRQKEGEEAPEGPGLLFFVNPEIVVAEGSTLFEEGCLSLPGITVEIERHTHVVMRALDRHGKPFEVDAEGLFAIALQHELDHLDGRLLVDRLSALKRELTRKKMKRTKAERAEGIESEDEVQAL